MDRSAAGAVFRSLRIVIQVAFCLCFFAHAQRSYADDSRSKGASCGFADPTLNDTSDIAGVIDYKTAIRQLFATQKFQELDCIADTARASKNQFAGGRWKLNVLYWAIEEPQGHATEEDWAAHLRELKRWVSVRPKSITARVALANSYTAYAWTARGSDYADTVTQSGWRLLHERIDKAKTILDEASRLNDKCPHWYAVMQRVALAEGWDPSRESALLSKAVAFEPGYYYYYRNHANFLKPQWNGEEGDAERFAAQAADSIGGAKGDVLYFQIATELICHCSTEPDLKLMSWPRIQAGVAQLEKQNGVSLFNQNLLAYMAIKESDSLVARDAFLRVGDNWDQELWRTRKYFDSSREWAAKRAEYEDLPSTRIIRQAREKFAPAIQQCVQTTGGDMTRFSLHLSVQKEGTVDSVRSFPATAAGSCLTKLNGETLSPPPYVPFMFNIDVDPAEILRLAAK